jgi:DNA-binding transcriptional LysR family regulator
MDVAVRMAVLTDSSLIVHKIGEIERVLCASPDYLSRHGSPSSIKDLERHQCLLLRFPSSQPAKWTLTRSGRQVSVPVKGPMDADDSDIITEWAVAGEGIAIKPVFEIADHLKSGALVSVLPDCAPAPLTLAILHAYRRMVPLKVKAFAELAVEDVRRHIALAVAGLDGKAARGRRSASR